MHSLAMIIRGVTRLKYFMPAGRTETKQDCHFTRLQNLTIASILSEAELAEVIHTTKSELREWDKTWWILV